MLTTKKNELHVINSFNDLMKDTQEKQKINQMVKQYSYDYFMSKLSDSELEDNKDNIDVFEELSNRYQKYSYVIARNIFDKIKEENSEEEEYYDGSYDRNGFQITKTRKVFKRDSFGKGFADSLEEELTNLVVDSYFKNLDKALDSYKFNVKLRQMKEREQNKVIKSKSEDIEKCIVNEIKDTYNYYINRKNSKEDILYNFKYNSEVINSMFTRVISKIDYDLDLKIEKKDIETKMNKEIKQFVRLKELEEDEEDESGKIPLGWKAYAITKFINKMFK